MFNDKLIKLTFSKCPTVFKKDELLYSWYNKQGKTCQEFKEYEFERWKVYINYVEKYDRDILMNQKTFDEKKVKNRIDLRDLCYEYYSKYS